jgi:hypothetical protein
MTVLRDHGCGEHKCARNIHAGDVLAFAEQAVALAR